MVQRPIKRARFEDKDSGISSEVIDSCMDVMTLMDWKITIDSNITHTQMKIDEIRGVAAGEGKYHDPKKWAGINGYRKVLGFLSQKIQMRVRELNHNNKKQDDADINRLFVTIAKNYLSPEMFSHIADEAKVQRDKMIGVGNPERSVATKV